MNSRAERWARAKRLWAIALTGAVLALVGLGAMDPFARWQTQRRMDAIFAPAYRVTLGDARLHPLKGSLVLENVKVIKDSAGGAGTPWVQYDQMELKIRGEELRAFRVVGLLAFTGLKMNLIASHDPEKAQLASEVPGLLDRLAAAIPVTVDRIEVRGGEVTLVDEASSDFPGLHLGSIEAAFENLAPEAALDRGSPSTFAISARVQESATFSAFFTADPLEKTRFFAGQAMLADFNLEELGPVFARTSGVSIARGRLDLAAEVECRAGKLQGGVRPVFKNLKLVAGKPGPGPAIDAAIANGAFKVLAREDGVRAALSSAIPIRGNIDGPQAAIWPTVVSIVRQSFASGIAEGLQRP